MDEGILNDDVPFDGSEVYFFLLIFLIGVVDGTYGSVVYEVGSVNEGRCFHAAAY